VSADKAGSVEVWDQLADISLPDSAVSGAYRLQTLALAHFCRALLLVILNQEKDPVVLRLFLAEAGRRLAAHIEDGE
jgi:hypothetical protein